MSNAISILGLAATNGNTEVDFEQVGSSFTPENNHTHYYLRITDSGLSQAMNGGRPAVTTIHGSRRDFVALAALLAARFNLNNPV
jgi:hypothetical protein